MVENSRLTFEYQVYMPCMCECVCFFLPLTTFANFLMWIHRDERAIHHWCGKNTSQNMHRIWWLVFFLYLRLHTIQIHQKCDICISKYVWSSFSRMDFIQNCPNEKTTTTTTNCIKLGLWLFSPVHHASQPCMQALNIISQIWISHSNFVFSVVFFVHSFLNSRFSLNKHTNCIAETGRAW